MLKNESFARFLGNSFANFPFFQYWDFQNDQIVVFVSFFYRCTLVTTLLRKILLNSVKWRLIFGNLPFKTRKLVNNYYQICCTYGLGLLLYCWLRIPFIFSPGASCSRRSRWSLLPCLNQTSKTCFLKTFSLTRPNFGY